MYSGCIDLSTSYVNHYALSRICQRRITCFLLSCVKKMLYEVPPQPSQPSYPMAGYPDVIDDLAILARLRYVQRVSPFDQHQFIEYAGVSPRTYEKYLKRDPQKLPKSVLDFLRICSAHRIDPLWLITGFVAGQDSSATSPVATQADQ